MYRAWPLLLASIILFGCSDRPDPRDREDFVDTANDPARVLETMEPADDAAGGPPAPAPAP